MTSVLVRTYRSSPTLMRVYRSLLRICRYSRWSPIGLYYRSKVRNGLVSFDPPYKLHLGCGPVRLDKWVNVDLDYSVQPDVVWDLTKGIPLNDHSCELIYCEHLLEHMSVDEGLSLLHECNRVLRPGGILRVAMPSLDALIEKSYLGNWREQDWLTWPEYQFIQTRAEMLNVAFRWWGHQWLYDREELHRRLREAGFENVRDVTWGTSSLEDLSRLETRKDSLLICEARK
jgi:predicted SAM-dependent methyltransferase